MGQTLAFVVGGGIFFSLKTILVLFICQKHISDKCINENLLFCVVYKNCLILSFNCLQILHTSLSPRLISGVYIDDVQDNCFIL